MIDIYHVMMAVRFLTEIKLRIKVSPLHLGLKLCDFSAVHHNP